MTSLGQYTLETPENVQVSFELAGPGSRLCALIIDTLLMWLMALVILVLFAVGGARWGRLSRLSRFTDSTDTDGWFTWANALLIAAVMVLLFGYYTFFELVMGGQTPGKRTLKLRVLRDDGTPAAPLDIVVRNLIRVVDALPGFYALGGVVCLFSATNKRLGDMAAGTMVVKDSEIDYRAQAEPGPAPPSPEVEITNAALTIAEQRLIRGFLERREQLLVEARRQLAEQLAHRLLEAHGGHFDDAESYIERLAGGRHFER